MDTKELDRFLELHEKDGIAELDPDEWREYFLMNGRGQMLRLVIAELLRLREATRWIPVQERLPDNDVEVLAWTVSNWSGAAVRTGRQWHCIYNDETIHGVTHWFFLPHPPITEDSR